MTLFYDTNALLHTYDIKSNDHFVICNLTLKELESIKQNPRKDAQVKYKARHLINWLMQNKNMYYVEKYNYNWDKDLQTIPILSDNTDSRIIICALRLKNIFPDLKFITFDSNCACVAQDLGLNTEYPLLKDELYVGYKEIICQNDDQLVEFYSSFNDKQSNIYDLLTNEYVIIRDKDNNVLSSHKYLGIGKGYTHISEMPFDSKMFGKIKAKDIYQQIAMDSMQYNPITVIRGPAGTGKSLLSLGYLFDRIEKGKIDRIIIFCNTVATQGSAKLGYYPGDKDQKLLDSQIGNFLGSKLGDKMAVERLIDEGQLLLLPMSDIRGFDTTGMKAGIYITQAQNMSIELMKLALQRAGEDSCVILDGDSQCQVDLGAYAGINNGLRRVSKIFQGQNIYGEVTLKNIYRSRIARIADNM